MTEGTRPGVRRRTVVAGVCRSGPAERRLRHPARGRRPPCPARTDPDARACRGRAGGPDPRHRGPGRARRHRSRRPRRRPRHPPPPASTPCSAPRCWPTACLPPTSTPPHPSHRVPHVHGLAGRHGLGRALRAGGGRGRVGGDRRPLRRGRGRTCGPPSRRCTRSGTPRRPSSPAARRPCPRSRSPATGWAPWPPSTSAAVYFLEIVSARSTGGQRARVGHHPRRAARPARRPAGRRRPARRLARAPAAVPGRRRSGRGPAGPARR